ncbi:MAG: glycosyltransferase family 2 protein [Candidatus Melainabacteria bacterium]|nr:glycosyltransferase family 2 protein [Candidatus Melainabacteria bacterium]
MPLPEPSAAAIDVPISTGHHNGNGHARQPRPWLSVIIPAYNEEDRLPQTLAELGAYFLKAIPLEDKMQHQPPRWIEVILVSDGSTDATTRVFQAWLETMANNPAWHCQATLVAYPHRRGKGYAVAAGIRQARGQWCLLYDADASTPIEELERLLPLAWQHPRAVLIGSRAKAATDTAVTAKWQRRLLGRVFNRLLGRLTPGIEDTQCGFKLFPGKLAKALFAKQTQFGFAFDVEILHMALRNGVSVLEVPINWRHVSGSKIHLLADGLKMLLSVLRIALNSGWGHYRLRAKEPAYRLYSPGQLRQTVTQAERLFTSEEKQSAG